MSGRDAQNLILAALREVAAGHPSVAIEIADGEPLADLAREVEKLARVMAEKRAEAALVDRMHAYAELGAGITHEIKNPMTGVIGLAQVGGKRATDTEKAKKLFGLIEDQAHRCIGVVQRFLQFARQRDIERQRIDINDLLLESSDALQHQLAMTNVTLQIEPTPEVPQVIADAGQLRQVLLNILLNAQQAMPGGGTVVVTSGRSSDGKATIIIRDDGPGMQPEVAARVFEPFFTTKAPDKGTGLGLAITFGIIRDHGGSIHCHSEQNRGTIFTIELPAA